LRANKAEVEIFIGESVIPSMISSGVISLKTDNSQEFTRPVAVPASGSISFNETLVLKKVDLNKPVRVALKDASAKRGSRTFATASILLSEYASAAEPTVVVVQLQPADLTVNQSSITVQLKISIGKQGLAETPRAMSTPREVPQVHDAVERPEAVAIVPVHKEEHIIVDTTKPQSSPKVPSLFGSSGSSDTNRKLEESESENLRLKAKLYQEQTMVQELQTRLDELAYTNSDLKTRWLESQKDNMTLRSQLEDAEKRNEEYRLQLAALNSSVDKLMVKVTEGAQPKPKTIFGIGKKPKRSESSNDVVPIKPAWGSDTTHASFSAAIPEGSNGNQEAQESTENPFDEDDSQDEDPEDQPQPVSEETNNPFN